MSRIRSKNTKPELIVRKFLYNNGLRYRLHAKDLPGKPDISNKQKKFAVFVNGCFWHQHKGCNKSVRPKTNRVFWEKKLDRNIERDYTNRMKLEDENWKVFIAWECEIKNNLVGVMDRLVFLLRE